jgi:hypothetical protein
MATTIRARIYARGEASFAKFLFLPSWFAKPLEANFSYFCQVDLSNCWSCSNCLSFWVSKGGLQKIFLIFLLPNTVF